jgi:amidase
MMGSLRNPAGWNNIYSCRPSAGMIDSDNAATPENPLQYPISTPGPMARNPMDVAFLLEIMATKEKFDANDVKESPSVDGMRIAWLGDWGGAYPMEDGILELCRGALDTFSEIGVTVDDLEAIFDDKDLWRSWTTIRSKVISGNFPIPKPLLRVFLFFAPIRDELKWEVRRSIDISKDECTQAGEIANEWSQCLTDLFQKYDALALPTAQTWAFPADWRWPQEIARRKMDTYHRWMECTLPGSLGGLPCVTIPAGFGENGLPMGVQLLGKRGTDAKVLNLAQAYHVRNDWPGNNPPALE